MIMLKCVWNQRLATNFHNISLPDEAHFHIMSIYEVIVHFWHEHSGIKYLGSILKALEALYGLLNEMN